MRRNMRRNLTRNTILATLYAGAILSLAACSGIDLGDNPGREVSKETGPLTVPPPHLKDGASE